MSIDEAIQLVKEQYENDLESAYIVNPVAHALYEVWKKADGFVAKKSMKNPGSCNNCPAKKNA